MREEMQIMKQMQTGINTYNSVNYLGEASGAVNYLGGDFLVQ